AGKKPNRAKRAGPRRWHRHASGNALEGKRAAGGSPHPLDELAPPEATSMEDAGGIGRIHSRLPGALGRGDLGSGEERWDVLRGQPPQVSGPSDAGPQRRQPPGALRFEDGLSDPSLRGLRVQPNPRPRASRAASLGLRGRRSNAHRNWSVAFL